MPNKEFGTPEPSSNPNDNVPQQPGPPAGAWRAMPSAPHNQPAQQAWSTQDSGQQRSGNTSQLGVGKHLDLSNKSTLWLASAAAASLLSFIGSLISWGKITAPFVGTINISGTDGDGIFTLILSLVNISGIAAMLISGWWSSNRWRSVPVIVIGALLLSISYTDINEVTSIKEELEEESASFSLGGGLILILVASIAIIIFGVLTLLNDKKEMASARRQLSPTRISPGTQRLDHLGKGSNPTIGRATSPRTRSRDPRPLP